MHRRLRHKLSPRRLPAWQLTAFGILLVAGCGDNPLGRQAVQGTVRLDGAALHQGNIEFVPQAPQGVSSGTAIRDGRYAIEATKGLPPGEYQVRIFSSTKSEAPRTPEEAALPADHRPGRERIDPRFNTTTTLSVEVRPDTDNVFDFDVEFASP
ncbi:MAG: carboxypeptidase-like regulatory domain-containing protein [Pirellulales bacterium]